MIVIADAGPLIILRASGYLDLLPGLFGAVCVPDVVADEVLSFDPREFSWIKVETVPLEDVEAAGLLHVLDAGEAAALTLALRHTGALVVMDDRDGRREAARRTINVTGSVGVLLQAKALGLIPAVRPALAEFHNQNAWLSDGLFRYALEVAGEE